MSAHPHSALSLAGEVAGGRLGRRAAAILAWVRARANPETDRAIAAGLGFADMNAVRPRITEMVEAGLLAEVGEIRCPVTGKPVRTVALGAARQDSPAAVDETEVRLRAARRRRRARPLQMELRLR